MQIIYNTIALCETFDFQVFEDLAIQKKGRVTVFYCGPPGIAAVLSKYCLKYNFGFRQEPV